MPQPGAAMYGSEYMRGQTRGLRAPAARTPSLLLRFDRGSLGTAGARSLLRPAGSRLRSNNISYQLDELYTKTPATTEMHAQESGVLQAPQGLIL